MKEFSVSVLGSTYKCLIGSREETGLDVNTQGECRNYAKQIVVCDEFDGDHSEKVHNKMLEEVILHELAHAFLYESGLVDYSSDEVIVQWVSVNLKKMLKSLVEIKSNLNLTKE